jgi:hypothetical protein
MRQDRPVRFASFAALVLIALPGCSDDSGTPMTCDEIRVRISEIESTAASGEQSWDAVLEGTVSLSNKMHFKPNSLRKAASPDLPD